ncbi:MAG: hypothetical protein GY816_16865 [Cytophagales bacterium]|nr:hypothetical protein [Cytophagales bacterium]
MGVINLTEGKTDQAKSDFAWAAHGLGAAAMGPVGIVYLGLMMYADSQPQGPIGDKVNGSFMESDNTRVYSHASPSLSASLVRACSSDFKEKRKKKQLTPNLEALPYHIPATALL